MVILPAGVKEFIKFKVQKIVSDYDFLTISCVNSSSRASFQLHNSVKILLVLRRVDTFVFVDCHVLFVELIIVLILYREKVHLFFSFLELLK
jgi:hypothetical protein